MRTRLLDALALALATPLVAQSAVDDGELAPEGCWYTAGGCAARNGATLTGPVLRQPAEAWRFAVEGEIEGEPLVWRDVVVVCERRGEDTRILHCLDLAAGEPFCRPLRFTTTAPLGPSLWDRHLAVRTAPDAVVVYRIARPVAEEVRRIHLDAPASAPLLLGDELFVVAGSAWCFRLGKEKDGWKAGERLAGEVAVRGHRVYALRCAGAETRIECFDRESGKALDGYDVPFPVPASPGCATIAVGSHSLLLCLQKRITADTFTGPVEVGAAEYRAGSHGGPMRCLKLDAPPCEIDGAWLVRTTEQAGSAWVQLVYAPREGARLVADGEHHADLLSHTAGASLAGFVAYLGDAAFDTREGSAMNSTYGRVFWRLGLRLLQRPVPARDGVLVVDAKDRVLLLRGDAPRTDWRSLLSPAPLPLRVPEQAEFKGTFAVTAAGVQPRNTVRFDKAAGTYLVARTAVPADQVHLLVDGDKKRVLHWNGSPRQVADGLAALIEEQVDEAYFALARQSQQTNHVPTIEYYLEQARQRGASKALLGELSAGLRRIAALKHRVRENKVAELRAAEQAVYTKSLGHNRAVYDSLAGVLPFEHALACAVVMLHRDPKLFDAVLQGLQRHTAALSPAQRVAMAGALLAGAPLCIASVWQWIAPAVDDLPAEDRVRLLRLVFEVEPRHAAASAKVHAMVPIRVPGIDKIPAAEWLDLLEATKDLRLTVVTVPPPEEAGSSTPEIRELVRQIEVEWQRKDLIALQSERLLVITPLANPGRLARCLSLGELLCDELERMFAYSQKTRGKANRMKLLLYDSQKEYLEKSLDRGAGGHVVWSSGHYSPFHRKAAMFLPRGEGAFDAVMDVLAHELAHYWLDVQCPLFDFFNQAQMPHYPGFWIVEGFASMVEGFDYDLRRRAVATVKRNFHHLDVLANAGEGQTLPWTVVFGLSQIGLHKLRPEPLRNAVVTPAWRLGTYSMLGHVDMFYMQSAAACHYLFHAEDGKYRQRLMSYVGDYYTGRRDALDVEAVFGLSPNELGKRIVAYGKQVTAAR